MSDVTIYHNPACGTSRNVLGLIRNAGIEPHVIEYLKDPPSRSKLIDLIASMGLGPRALLREKGTPFHDLGLDDPTLDDAALLDAMLAHPILINRPIVVTPSRAKLCRPSDTVLDLLASPPLGDIRKEDGTSVLTDEALPAGPELIDALRLEGLPIDDVGEPGRIFFRYRRLSGAVIGYGGFEPYDHDVLLRSIVVLPAERGHGLGRDLTSLLMSRAFDQGARDAYALTSTAAPFFQRLGFKPLDRSKAPATILATRQATALCPSTAVLLRRRISL